MALYLGRTRIAGKADTGTVTGTTTTTDTPKSSTISLVLNRISQTMYDTLFKGNQISSNELYLTEDDQTTYATLSDDNTYTGSNTFSGDVTLPESAKIGSGYLSAIEGEVLESVPYNLIDESDIDDTSKLLVSDLKSYTTVQILSQYIQKLVEENIEQNGNTMLDTGSGSMFYVTDGQINNCIQSYGLDNFISYPDSSNAKMLRLSFPKNMHLKLNTSSKSYIVSMTEDTSQIASWQFGVRNVSSVTEFDLQHDTPLYIYNNSVTDISSQTDLILSYYPILPFIDTNYDSIKTLSNIDFINGVSIGSYMLSDIMDIQINASDEQSLNLTLVSLSYDNTIDKNSDMASNLYTGLRLTITPKVDFKMWFPNFTQTLTNGSVNDGINEYTTYDPVKNAYQIGYSNLSYNGYDLVWGNVSDCLHFKYTNSYIIGYHNQQDIKSDKFDCYEMKTGTSYDFYFRSIFESLVSLCKSNTQNLNGFYRANQQYITSYNQNTKNYDISTTYSNKLYYPNTETTPFYGKNGYYSFNGHVDTDEDYGRISWSAGDVKKKLSKWLQYINMNIQVDVSQLDQ